MKDIIDKKKVGNFIASLRKSKKKEDGKSYTQSDLAKELLEEFNSLSINSVAEWENGKSLPSIEKLAFLSKYFNVSMDELLEGEKCEDVDFDKLYPFGGHNAKNINPYKEKLRIISRFKELIFIKMERNFTSFEEKEFKYLFCKYFELSNHLKETKEQIIKDDYIYFKKCMNEVLFETRNMSAEEKYWEVQKLFTEKEIIQFSFWRNVERIDDDIILENYFKQLENWQKDMFLAMFQNTLPYFVFDEYPPSYRMKEYEEQYGEEYNRDNIIKKYIKSLIRNGAVLNSAFFNKTIKKKELIKTIDRLEELYETCKKSLEIVINNDKDEFLIYKIENNEKNRFLANYYSNLRFCLENDNVDDNYYTHLDKLYKWFKNNEEITDEMYLKSSKNRVIHNDNQNERYKLADAKNANILRDYFNEFKEKENRIKAGLIEMEELEKRLKNGEKYLYMISDKMIGGKDEKEIRCFIELWKADMDYSDFVNHRDLGKTNNLIKEIDKLTYKEIKEKYFKGEIIYNE